MPGLVRGVVRFVGVALLITFLVAALIYSSAHLDPRELYRDTQPSTSRPS